MLQPVLRASKEPWQVRFNLYVSFCGNKSYNTHTHKKKRNHKMCALQPRKNIEPSHKEHLNSGSMRVQKHSIHSHCDSFRNAGRGILCSRLLFADWFLGVLTVQCRTFNGCGEIMKGEVLTTPAFLNQSVTIASRAHNPFGGSWCGMGGCNGTNISVVFL